MCYYIIVMYSITYSFYEGRQKMKKLIEKLKNFWGRGKLQKGIVIVVVLMIIGLAAGGGNAANKDKNNTKKDDITETDTNNNKKENDKKDTSKDENDAPAQEPSETYTLGQKNAMRKANDYLNYSAFSYTGLIEQLKYEGYSVEDATFAVDRCGADWNQQAAKKAQDYLDYSAFSREGLIDQLKYEGFTQEQAEYGATAVGY